MKTPAPSSGGCRRVTTGGQGPRGHHHNTCFPTVPFTPAPPRELLLLAGLKNIYLARGGTQTHDRNHTHKQDVLLLDFLGMNVIRVHGNKVIHLSLVVATGQRGITERETERAGRWLTCRNLARASFSFMRP